ncbi:hypothetical protein PFISCL1PPCAC_25612, partial [Pristionchus fissidentatus]
LFVRFRPNLLECQKVINYSYRMWPRGQEWKSNVSTRITNGPGDPVSMPDELVRAVRDDKRRRYALRYFTPTIRNPSGMRFGIPRRVTAIMEEIGAGAAPYPASTEEFARDWWPTGGEQAREE